MAGDLAFVSQLDNPVRAFETQADDLLWRQNFHSKPLGLHNRTASQVATTKPGGKTKIVLDSRTHPRLSTRRLPLNHYRVQPFRGTVHGGGQAGWSTTDNCEVVKASLGTSAQSDLLCHLGRAALKKFSSIGEQHNRKIGRFRAQNIQQTLGFRIAGRQFNVDPLVRNVASRQEVAQVVGAGGPAGTQYSYSLKRGVERGLPIIEQIVQLGIQMERGRVPRLQEKVMNAHLIDRADGSTGIRVRGEQRTFRIWKDAHTFLQKLDPIHPWHALIGEQQSHVVAAQLQLLQKLKSLLGRIAADHAILGAILRTEITLDRPQNIGIIVHAEQDWFGHGKNRWSFRLLDNLLRYRFGHL